jgi:8-oxo-dGTP pyrophosphatase MutT (NUDIX family)
MPKAMPVGTIRRWESGEYIKAHDGSVFHNGWIPLSTSTVLEEIGKGLDAIANAMRFHKLPINGEKFLDHEIGEFEKPPGKEFGKYTPDDFKQYEGFAGAGRYSFRNEFSRRFMKPKLDLAEKINDALLIENERQGGSWNDDRLTPEVKAEIRARVRAEYKEDAKANNEYFSVKEAEELAGIVKRTNKQLEQGLNFEGEQKKIYDSAVATADSLPVEYARIGVKRRERDDAMLAVNEAFPDNWGVRESFKFYAENKYSEYIRKYKDRIRQDEAKEQESVFGVALDEDPSTFYPKLYAKLKSNPEKYLFNELINLRFETKYDKQMSGNWDYKMLPAVEQIEYMMLNTPSGHFLTNKDLKAVTQEDYNGGNHGGYAWYSSTGRNINLSKALVAESPTSQWSRLNHLNEFQSTMAHEIGHAVSNKFGRAHNLKYKEFVVACGWSYSQEELRLGMTATGGDRDIPRLGSNAHLPLFTEYAHKSPEEAFAEYYSLYHNNKAEIDHWLDHGDSSVLSKTSRTISDSKASTKSVNQMLNKINAPSEKHEINRLLNNIHLDPHEHVSVELISPWEASPVESERKNYAPFHVGSELRMSKGFTNVFDINPVVSVKDHNHYDILEGINRQVTAKYTKRMLPSVSISKELHSALSSRGYSDEAISNYAINVVGNQPVPLQSSAPRKVTGVDYRNKIVTVDQLKANENMLRKMRAVYGSDELKKAIDDLFTKADSYTDNYVAIVCVDDQDRVLLLKREDNGEWMLPGGHIDDGEVPLEAALREMKEETNLQFDLLEDCGCKSLPGGKEIYYFRCQYHDHDGESVLANIDLQNEATNFEWMTPEQWSKAKLFKDTKSHLRKLLLSEATF